MVIGELTPGQATKYMMKWMASFLFFIDRRDSFIYYFFDTAFNQEEKSEK